MWRDAQLEEHQTTEKRYQIILQAILPILQKWLQLALKHSALSAEQKRQLLELRKKLFAPKQDFALPFLSKALSSADLKQKLKIPSIHVHDKKP